MRSNNSQIHTATTLIGRAVLLLTVVGAMLLACAGVVPAQPASPDDPEQPTTPDLRQESEGYAPGEILVKFEEDAPEAKKKEAHSKNAGRTKKAISGIDVEVVGVERGKEKAKVADYEKDPNVEYAEFNGFYHALEEGDASAEAATNDARVNEQWQYNNTGQTGGTSGADIRAFYAWDATHGADRVAIAVLDTGIKSTHEDLRGKVVEAKDFTGSASGPEDVHGHGTHVAGSVAANGNNGIGVAGTCGDWSNCVLYNGKVLNDSGSGTWSGIAEGIRWAADNDAKVISMSLGGASGSQTVSEAVNYAWTKGAVLVAAAGNDGTTSYSYPAAYDNIIAVGATDHRDRKASYSNYGSWVDVAAPGSGILSTTVAGAYGTKSGTSMATPHVAGAAGLVWSTSPGATNGEVRERIESSTADGTVLSSAGPDWSKARIDACKAVGGTGCTAPTIITSPQDNSYDKKGSFKVKGTAEPASIVRLFEGSTLKGTAKTGSGGTWSMKLKGVSEGSHTYAAEATSRAGHTSGPSDSLTVIVDKTKPSVSSVTLPANETGVPRDTLVTATFSEGMNPSTLTSSTVKLLDAKKRQVPASVSHASNTVTLDPDTDLAPNSKYTATITTSAKDLAGNKLAKSYTWTFTTGS